MAKLGKREYNESIDEMTHADSLLRRILFLGGLPNAQRVDKVAVGENVEEILKADCARALPTARASAISSRAISY